MRKYIFLFFLFISIALNGQNIKGTVCHISDKSPVPFASVGLIAMPDSNMVTGVITLTDGGYRLEKIKPATYYLKVSFVGYETALQKVVVEQGATEIVADTIFLTETIKSLNEVNVTAERIKGKEMVDRTVYAVPSVIAKASVNGYDLLKKIPQVNVDFQNNVTLNGSSNFIIQVDGRQRDKEFLAKLLPTDIESVEVISNPSGKYEGNIDGVINIILKKEARYGINGNASLNIKPIGKPTTTITGSLDYAMGKITFYATGYTVTQKLNLSTINESYFAMNDSTSRLSGPGRIGVTASSINSGFDYYINEKNSLSFNVNYKPVSQDVVVDGSTLLSKSGTPLNTILSVTKTGLESDETSLSLFYKKSFKKPIQEFTAEASYYIFKSFDNSDFTNTRYPYLSHDILSTYSRLEENLNERNYASVKLNYVQPIGMNVKIETGYQLYYQDLKYQFTIDNNVTDNIFDYNELRNSVYGGVTFNLKKFGAQGMVRVENSHIMADSVTRPDYSCILPSVNLQYKFSATHNLKLTYNRRINRPGIYDMNPYYKIGQNYEITQGNPNLKPDYRDRMQMTYTWNFGSNFFSPYVYREYYTDRIGRDFRVITSPVNNTLTTLSKPYNLLSGYETGGGVNAMLWYVNINARVFKGHFNDYTGGSVTIPSVDYFSYSITSYAFAQLDKKKTATAYVFLQYTGLNRNAQSRTYTHPLYGIGVQKQLNNHGFGVFYLLPFSQDIRLNRTETETVFYKSRNLVNVGLNNYIQFTYSYKFNKGRSVKKVDKKIEIDSDTKSQTIGG
jgi:outer membrane receptor protein involved in Fe transport